MLLGEHFLQYALFFFLRVRVDDFEELARGKRIPPVLLIIARLDINLVTILPHVVHFEPLLAAKGLVVIARVEQERLDDWPDQVLVESELDYNDEGEADLQALVHVVNWFASDIPIEWLQSFLGLALQECDHLPIDYAQVCQIQVIDRPLVKVLCEHFADFNSSRIHHLQDLDGNRCHASKCKVKHSHEDGCFRVGIKNERDCVDEERVNQAECKE